MISIPCSAINIDKNIINPTNRGDILYVGGSGVGNYTSIQGAIDDADDGDTVFVYNESSPYFENIIINKSIFLRGENRDTTFIDGTENGDVIHIDSTWIYISGFTIQNGLLEYPSGGIYVSSKYGMISNNNIENNFYGIIMFHTEKLYIFNNNITNNNQCGIYLEGSFNNYISSNYINTQPYNGIGLYNSSNDNTIYNNTILNNKYSGIRITKCFDNYMYKNKISKNLFGIRLEFSSNNTIMNNNFIKNIYREAYHLGNTFLGHKNKWIGNYWNRPRVLPKPIFGRTGMFFKFIPYIDFDWFPAKQPHHT
jgi:parallel beta-helix repeat protein